MKISEFIESLSCFPQDAEIILSQDSEGNSFFPVDDVAQVLYSLVGQGDVYNLEEKEAAGENAINAVVLYPLDSYSLGIWQRAQLEQKHS